MDRKWKDEVKLQLDNVLSKYTKNSKKGLNFVSLSNHWKIQIAIYFTLAIVVVPSFMFEFIVPIIGIIGIIICSIAVLVFLTASIVMFTITVKMKKIKKKILTEIDVNDIYKNAFQEESDNKITVTSISRNFDVPILKFQPTAGVNYNDIVINMEIRGVKYSLGTVTNRIITATKDTTEFTYTRYPFLTIELNESLKIVATIKRLRKPILGIFKQKDNTELESDDFEKMYFVNANDQTAIRKLLTPKVMSDLIDEGSRKTIPKLFINNRYLTFSFPEYIVSSLKSPDGVFTVVNFTGKVDKLYDEICEKILNDFLMFKNYKRWFNIYHIDV